MPQVRIRYVDGVEVTAPPEAWPTLRADGVDWFEVVTEAGTVRSSGKSLYWLYERDGVWFAGGCGVGYDSNEPGVISELVIEGEQQSVRRRQYVPDIQHAEAKLGWWWPGGDES